MVLLIAGVLPPSALELDVAAVVEESAGLGAVAAFREWPETARAVEEVSSEAVVAAEFAIFAPLQRMRWAVTKTGAALRTASHLLPR
mmetsp:Transcript_14911/g.43004  ORF Transcript_14911/g.43004 Transcript_14911/m.43004 type:complete len:87 (+) Transcript_14911:1-261(+)